MKNGKNRSADQNTEGLLAGGAAGAILKETRRSMASVYEGERVLDGFASIGRVEAELSKAQDAPMDRPRQFEKARHWFKYQWFIREIIKLRYAFFHYGFEISGPKGKTSIKIRTWEENNRKMYRRYAREAWFEWLIMDNVVGLWREKGGRPPLVYPPERCEFMDIFGEEKLKVRHGVSQEHITTIGGFSRQEKAEFGKLQGELELTHDNATFGFDVLRRERTGSGFGVPTIANLFVVLAELQSLDVGHSQLAAACRVVMELHKMGHEIKSGLHAGSKAHFWNKQRATAFETQVKGKTGHIKASVNFDHNVVQAANWPDPKHYDSKKFDSGINRMALWSMPLGQMLLGKSMNPFLMPMFRAQASAERDYVGEHLKTVFTEALGAPEEMELTWSNRCFLDPRIFADLMKTGLAAGPLSQCSFLEESGFQQTEEMERKGFEAGESKKLTTPIYDAAHGPPKKPAGRSPGSRDGDDV